jgi:hypothetical protein
VARTRVSVSLEPAELEFVKGKAELLRFDLPTLLKDAALSALRYDAERAWDAVRKRLRVSVRGELLDHICSACGGRVMRVVGHGPTPGGNPVAMCTLCGRSKVEGFGDLCWCDYNHRSGPMQHPYRCVSFEVLKERPWLREAFMRAGSNPDSGTSLIGIMLTADMQRMWERDASQDSASGAAPG